jgi:hypothetical protein
MVISREYLGSVRRRVFVVKVEGWREIELGCDGLVRKTKLLNVIEMILGRE